MNRIDRPRFSDEGWMLRPTERKQRVTILLDSGLVAYFKASAGERG